MNGLVHVVVNATSGTGCPEGTRDDLEARFERRKLRARVHLAHSGEQVLAGVEEALRAGAAMVVAGGGDGTVSAVASRLVGSGVPLGVLPMGTLNHFAKDLKLPLNLDQAIDVIALGYLVPVDVGDVNGRTFINNSSIGLYPDIVLDRERQQRRLGRGKWHALLAASIAAARRFPVLLLYLKVDGKPLERRSPFVFIGNNEYQMEGFEIGARSGLNDGRLSLYVTQRTGRFGLFLLAVRALFKRLRQARDFDMLSATEVIIDTRRPRMRVATDGEVVTLQTPLRYSIRPAALKVATAPPGET